VINEKRSPRVGTVSRRRAGTALNIAQALADPVRLAILERLSDGPAAVSELVLLTGEGQPNVSNHLAVLRARGLVTVGRLGRQRLYEIADPAVAQVVESLLLLAGRSPARLQPSPSLADARTCYDHLAGRLGVAVFDALVRERAIEHPAPRYRGGIGLGPRAAEVFDRLGIDVEEARRERRQFAAACGDWTERRPHLGGALGAALWSRALASGWVVRRPGTRVVVVTPSGRRTFHNLLGIILPDGRRPDPKASRTRDAGRGRRGRTGRA
jgi:DNA-binding transcriptional ArsR family regulator